MHIIALEAVLPEIGKSETRVIQVLEICEVPQGSYAFVEGYCADPECDCQLVHFFVFGEDGRQHAQITYGWQSKAFYDKTFLFSDHNFPGPDLAMLTPDGPYAKGLLELCKTVLLKDKAYVERLKRHHELFKAEAKKRDLTELIEPSPMGKSPSQGRNDPCLCGSGKKYKKCCY